MIKTIMLICSITFSGVLFAGNIIDVYGIDDKQSKEIIKKYGKQIDEIEQSMQLAIRDSTKPGYDEKKLQAIFTKREKFMDAIKKKKGYLMIDMQTIFYPDKKNQYTTIEVISKDEPQRLRYITPRIKENNYQNKGDIIDKMEEYTQTTIDLIFTNQLESKLGSCPVYHCSGGFNHPKLKPYLAIFNEGVSQHKQMIIDTLVKDPNPERRASAAFLVGHFANPNEIISILLPSVNDQNNGVRNNAIRVIAETMTKAKIHDIDPEPFLALLDSPYTTDRNKSLAVLFQSAESKTAKIKIKQQSGQKLINLLKLKQPNNHDMAYVLLKKISGKNYGEHDIKSWQKWLASA